ncbi:MAG TPA: hypothetical protein DCR46_01605 [Cytophagales bacterium]|nr:hypothetical protein [Cytophagales bacterium]
MNYKSAFLVSSLLGLGTVVHGQTSNNNQFWVEGYGRAIVTSNNLKAEAADNKTSTNTVYGYTLFDLSNNLRTKNLWANAILRGYSPFGGFFGTGTVFNFRQFQLGGNIGKAVSYELGDINVGEGMSHYSVNNFDDLYSRFESPLLSQRKDILLYENFNFGNLWRLQGVQSRAKFKVGDLIDTVSLYGFAARTNATDDRTVADRILSGGRVGIDVLKYLNVGGNYVALLDVPINTATMKYRNEILSGNAKLNMPIGNDIFVHAGTDLGMSSYTNTNSVTNVSVSYKDYYYEGLAGITYKPIKLKFTATYREVGPQFSSPTAQTRRVNNVAGTQLFSQIAGVARSQSLFDRYTQENMYNRVILPTLQEFNPIYSNIHPYGVATPNRRGFILGLKTDTSAKIIDAEFVFENHSEVVGEGVTDPRVFTGIRAGMSFNLGRFIASERNFIFQGGYRAENTTRAGENESGKAGFTLKSTIIDAGVSLEVVKKVDLLAGAKQLVASGSEFISKRDEFNEFLTTELPVKRTYDVKDMVYSVGARYRINNTSHLTFNYNVSDYEDMLTKTRNNTISQYFLNFTMKL